MPVHGNTKHGKRVGANRDKRHGDSKHKRPFVGVDGEGRKRRFDENDKAHMDLRACIKPMTGVKIVPTKGYSHDYTLLRVGEDYLYHDDTRLTTLEIFAFLTSLPVNKEGFEYVAFAFEYDVSHWLRDIPTDRMEYLFDRAQRTYMISDGKGGKRAHTYPVEWNGYEFDYIPRKEFKIRHIGDKDYFIVSDVFGHFQSSFVQALDKWHIVTADELKRIADDKANRADFTEIGPHEIEYNKLECEYLATLMSKVRDACLAIDIVPSKWQGAGQLAQAMLDKQGVPTAKELESYIPEHIVKAANAAYYGGRFEVTRFGHAPYIHEYDISSAYPAAMRSLPCLIHARFVEGIVSDIYVADIHFKQTDEEWNIGPFPIRLAEGIVFPREGKGWYWSHEIDAAKLMGTEVTVNEAYSIVSDCNCDTFRFVEDAYAARKNLEKGKSEVMKFAINSLYGKLAQHKGSVGKYLNKIWAGLITSKTRAMLMTVCLTHKGHCIRMMATDGIYLDHPVNVPHVRNEDAPEDMECDCIIERPHLGNWEHNQYGPEFFIFRPGMYYKGSDKVKSRGIPRDKAVNVMKELIDKFDNPPVGGIFDWDDITGYMVRRVQTAFTRSQMYTNKLALMHNKRELAGQWVTVKRQFRIDPRPKRDWPDNRYEYEADGSYTTKVLLGGPDWESVQTAEMDVTDDPRFNEEGWPDETDLVTFRALFME